MFIHVFFALSLLFFFLSIYFIFLFSVLYFVFFFFFFFSSRRRHTRCLSDWSSDVCSSDLHHRNRRQRTADVGPRLLAAGRNRGLACDIAESCGGAGSAGSRPLGTGDGMDVGRRPCHLRLRRAPGRGGGVGAVAGGGPACRGA